MFKEEDKRALNILISKMVAWSCKEEISNNNVFKTDLSAGEQYIKWLVSMANKFIFFIKLNKISL